jgi:hypothetical protein
VTVGGGQDRQDLRNEEKLALIKARVVWVDERTPKFSISNSGLTSRMGEGERTEESMRIRCQTLEHTYGTIKLWMGSANFLIRTLTHVDTEMSLHVLAYNFKRVIKKLGIKGLMEAIKAWAGHYGDQTNTIVGISWAYHKHRGAVVKKSPIHQI